MTSQNSRVVEILKQHGPLASNDLANCLVNARLASNEVTARKMIERADIRSTKPIRFDKAFLYYLDEHAGPKYANAIRNLLPQKPSFNRVYKTLLANKGWITAGQIGKSSGCLPPQSTSHAGGRLELNSVIEQLKTIKLIDTNIGEDNIFRIGTQFGNTDIGISTFRRKIALEQELIPPIIDWLKNCYSLAHQSHSYRQHQTQATEFNDALFDIYGPIYFGPFATPDPEQLKKPKHGFITADLLAYRTFTIIDAQALIERTKTINIRWKNTTIIPLAIAASYSKEAWKLLKRCGIITITLGNVLGPHIDDLLHKFNLALSATDLSEDNLNNIETSLKLAQDPKIDEGLLGNIKGALFELIIALTYRSIGYDTTLQKKIKGTISPKTYEIDVVAIRGGTECKLIECKGRHRGYQENAGDLARHFDSRCQTASDEYGWNITQLYKNVEAIYITSGSFSPEARSYVESNPRKHGISCKAIDRENLFKLLEDANQSRLIEVVNQYY